MPLLEVFTGVYSIRAMSKPPLCSPMKRFRLSLFVIAFSCAGILPALTSPPLSAANDEQAAVRADQSFAERVGKADKAATEKYLDVDFSWTDAAGKTFSRREVLASLPKPSIANETAEQETHRNYADLELIQARSGRANILRIWVKRAAGWRLLVYQEATLTGGTPTPIPGTAETCDNPCKSLPYKPKNETEREVLAGYMALQTATVYHNSADWGKYVAEEFSAASSNSNKVLDKQGRMADLERSKMAGYAPMPVEKLQLFDFAEAVVLKSQHQPLSGKPVHITRLWIKRDGKWLEAVSYQTRIEAAPARPPQ